MTRTVVLIPTAAVLVPYAYSTQYKVSCRVQVLPSVSIFWDLVSVISDVPVLPSLSKGRCVSL